jgi:hypothetical protein
MVQKRNTYTERLTPPLVKEEAAFSETPVCLGQNENLGRIYRRGLKPRMTVLLKANSNLTD